VQPLLRPRPGNRGAPESDAQVRQEVCSGDTNSYRTVLGHVRQRSIRRPCLRGRLGPCDSRVGTAARTRNASRDRGSPGRCGGAPAGSHPNRRGTGNPGRFTSSARRGQRSLPDRSLAVIARRTVGRIEPRHPSERPPILYASGFSEMSFPKSSSCPPRRLTSVLRKLGAVTAGLRWRSKPLS